MTKFLLTSIICVSLVTGVSAAAGDLATTSAKLDVAGCLPFLRQVAFNRESRIPDDPVQFARALITQYDIFKNPILATVAMKRIGEDKLKEWVKAGIKEEDIDPSISADIFDAFLRELHPDETNADTIFDLWKKSPKDFGQIKWDDFKVWQDLAREFTYEPRKAELGSGFLRAFLPEYAKYLSVWNSYRKPFLKNWGMKQTFQSLAAGAGGFALAAMIDGGISLILFSAVGLASPALNRFASQWKNSRLNGRLGRTGPEDFKTQLGSKNLLPSDIEHFKLVLSRVVDIDRLINIQPEIDLKSKTSIMDFGSIFNPLMLATVNLLTDLQENIYTNLRTDKLQQRFPENSLKALELQLANADIEGIITETERLKSGISDARRKVELLKSVFLNIREKMSEFIRYLDQIERKVADQKDIAEDIADRQRHFHELFQTAEQISQTLDLVDSSIAVDNRYLDALARAIAAKQLQLTIEMGKSTSKGSTPVATPAKPPKPFGGLF